MGIKNTEAIVQMADRSFLQLVTSCTTIKPFIRLLFFQTQIRNPNLLLQELRALFNTFLEVIWWVIWSWWGMKTLMNLSLINRSFVQDGNSQFVILAVHDAASPWTKEVAQSYHTRRQWVLLLTPSQFLSLWLRFVFSVSEWGRLRWWKDTSTRNSVRITKRQSELIFYRKKSKLTTNLWHFKYVFWTPFCDMIGVL